MRRPTFTPSRSTSVRDLHACDPLCPRSGDTCSGSGQRVRADSPCHSRPADLSRRRNDAGGGIAQRYGTRLAEPAGSLTTAFPEPVDLAEADIARLGITRSRAEAIRVVAQLVSSGRLQLTRRQRLDETYEQLLSIPGVGPWTASYVALRALGDATQ